MLTLYAIIISIDEIGKNSKYDIYAILVYIEKKEGNETKISSKINRL